MLQVRTGCCKCGWGSYKYGWGAASVGGVYCRCRHGVVCGADNMEHLVPAGCVCHDCAALLTSSCGNCHYVVSADLHRPSKAF